MKTGLFHTYQKCGIGHFINKSLFKVKKPDAITFVIYLMITLLVFAISLAL